MQTAVDIKTSLLPASVRPVLIARNGEQLPVPAVAPVSTFKRIAGQPDEQVFKDQRFADEATAHEFDYTLDATVLARNPGPVVSSQYLAQHIAQEVHGDIQATRARDAASHNAYRAADVRGTVFYGLEYPVDFSV